MGRGNNSPPVPRQDAYNEDTDTELAIDILPQGHGTDA